MAPAESNQPSASLPAARDQELELRRLEERLWIAQAQSGDKEAFASLVRRFEQPLLYFLRRLISDPEQSWDAYQETWIDAWSGLNKLVAPGAFRVWLYRIAHAKAARHIAREIRERDKIESIESTHSELPESTSTAHQNNFDPEAVHGALGQLPPEHRAALTLFYLEDMSLEEISTALDCPVGTVKSRLHNGRRALRKIISKENL